MIQTKKGRFRQHIEPDERDIIRHTVKESVELTQLEITAHLPTKKIRGGDIVRLMNLVREDYAGVVLLIQRPNGQNGQNSHHYDWNESGFMNDWDVVGGKLVRYDWCLKIKQCNCIFSLLEKCFRDSGLSDFGWQINTNNEGSILALRIVDTRSLSRT